MKYYPQSYKENLNSVPESKGRTHIRNNESQLVGDDEGNLSYSDHNEKAELKNVTSEETAYDREKELLDAINTPNEEDNEDDTPEWAKYAEDYNKKALHEVLSSKAKYESPEEVPSRKAPKDAIKIIDPEETKYDGIIDEDDTAYYDNKTNKRKKTKNSRQKNRANQHEVYIG